MSAQAPPATGPQVVRAAARAFERDRYLAALLAPAAACDDLIALAAFAGELARIPGDVSEPMIGEIRLQWWRDTIEAGLADGVPPAGHPIADALLAMVSRHRPPIALLQGLIDAQSQRLDDQPFADLAALHANLEAWDGALFRLAWHILAADNAREEPHALLTTAGKTYGLARCLIEAPADLAQGRVHLPGALLSAHGLTLESARATEAKQRWRALGAEIAVHIRQCRADILQGYQEADSNVRLAALPLALVRPYLRVSQQVDIAGLEAHDVGPLSRVWRLWLTSRTGRF